MGATLTAARSPMTEELRTLYKSTELVFQSMNANEDFIKLKQNSCFKTNLSVVDFNFVSLHRFLHCNKGICKTERS